LKQGFVVLSQTIINGSNVSLSAYEKILFKKINAGELILPVKTLSKNAIANIGMYIKIIFDEFIKFSQLNIKTLNGISQFIKNPMLTDKEFKEQCVKIIEKMDGYIGNKTDNALTTISSSNQLKLIVEANQIKNSKEMNSLYMPMESENIDKKENNFESKATLLDFEDAMKTDSNNDIDNKISLNSDSNKDIFANYYNDSIDNITDFTNNSILFDGKVIKIINNENKLEYGYLGKLINNNKQNDFLTDNVHDDQQENNKNIFLNVNKPFCLVCIGVQGI
jgi:hypothetical protein